MTQRPIKFRAWDENMGVMVPDFDNWIDFQGNHYTIPDKTYDTPHTEIADGKHAVILMQFTGLHDKNGKEVFEGDIVRVDNGKTYEVYWEDREFSWRFTDGGFLVKPQFPVSSLEVIGNIYENPELLKP